MYLVSLYFDETSDHMIRRQIERIAEKSGNLYMLEHQIPPHITIASCKEGEPDKLIEALDSVMQRQKQGEIQWVAAGSFLPHVLFLTPVLNRYLHALSIACHDVLQAFQTETEQNKYQPFAWLPHTTVARTMSDEQMVRGLRVLQANFRPFSGKIVRAGLAESHPYQDIKTWRFTE